MNIEKIIDILCQDKSNEQAEGFLAFLSDKLWNLYNEHLMDNVLVVTNKVNALALRVPNAKENQEYSQTVDIPDENMVLVAVKGISEEEHGLKVVVSEDGHSFTVSGTPSLEFLRNGGATVPQSTFDLTLLYKYEGIELPEDKKVLERKVPFVINQDPRKLWRNIPVDWEGMSEPKYFKEDTQCEYVKVEATADGTPQKDMVAASKRGRSHAQDGRPRDDHFRMEYIESNGWYIMSVADGAGSAKYSRAGSEIACNTAVERCKLKLTDSKMLENFEDSIVNYQAFDEDNKDDARKIVGDYLYQIIGTAAFNAHKAINAEAALQKIPVKQYATTLLLTICKHFDFGWFVASFWVGDGAICLYDKNAHMSKILGVPDEGEYAGQTRFLTMPEIFQDATALYQRLRFYIVDDFTALFLMSDGVSDPKFETDANLNNPDKWDALWDDLKENGVELIDDNEAAKEQLLDWLDFWAPGNHDDRTIAILYEGENNVDSPETLSIEQDSENK